MEIARRVGGELVSADSMQIYRGLDIGTAKPTTAERAEIPHAMLDVADPHGAGFTVADWLRGAEEAIADMHRRDRLPIIVGGTNLYLRAFFEGLDDAPQADLVFRASLETLSNESLREHLLAVDPARAEEVHREIFGRNLPNCSTCVTEALHSLLIWANQQQDALTKAQLADDEQKPKRKRK